MNQQRPFYHEYAWAYDLLVDGQIENRVAFVKQLVEHFNLQASSSILDAGCGIGGLSMALATEGFAVRGIDLSESLINEAIKRNPKNVNPYFTVENILGIEAVGLFDLILCRGVLNDFIDDAEREEVFKVFYKALKSNGLFVADVRYWIETIKRKTAFPLHKKKIETDKGLLTFISETSLNGVLKTLEIKETHKLEKDNEVQSSDYKFTMKCWTMEEINTYSLNNGFTIEHILSDYNMSASVGQTDRLVFVLKK